jgi:deoxyribodipyrimidine photolyase-related protein
MIGLIFPHQLFEDLAPWQNCTEVLLVEEFLFFKQYNFHQQKLAYHRASMKFYESYLRKNGIAVNYIESTGPRSDVRKLLAKLATKEVTFINPVDHWLEKRIIETSAANSINLHKLPNPGFLNSDAELAEYLRGKNRLKYPKNKIAPAVEKPATTPFFSEAVIYTRQHFGSNYGQLGDTPVYPHDFESSKKWLQNFLQTRFAEFGPYEDAIVANETILHHSVLTPMLNNGLLTPQFVVEETLRFAEENSIPTNSVEGFIRQIIGWREFIRMVYKSKGSAERTRNYWGFTRKIPPQFWDGTTGILPVDQTIKKVLKTGYCHHIERLMVVGNFMLLCEFDPDEVYRWFMELFIDAYDWVMVPNVYGMSQFADGGLMATKPYISGSNYLQKMSDYPKGDWQPIWDALFWRFMHQHRSFFLQNPRLGMLVKTFDKWDTAKQTAILARAETYLAGLDLD